MNSAKRTATGTAVVWLHIAVVITLAGCATPQIQLDSGDTAMEVKSKAPVIGGVAFSADGRLVASGSYDGVARVWDLKEAKQTLKLDKRPGWVSDVSFLPDGRTLAVSNEVLALLSPTGNKAETTLWDIRSGAALKAFPGRASVFSRDGRLAAGSGTRGGGAAMLSDVTAGSTIRGAEGFDASISPDGKYFAVCGTEDIGNILFAKFVSFVAVSDAVTGRRLWKTTAHCSAIAFTPDSRSLLVAISEYKHAGLGFNVRLAYMVLDAATGSRVKEFGESTASDSLGMRIVKTLALSADGKLFVSGDLQANYKIGEMESGKVLAELKTGGELAGTLMNALPSASFSPDGRTVIVGSLASARLFDVRTGKQLATLIGFEDGEWLLTTPEGYYNASEKGDQYLAVTVGRKPYTIAQLRESFFRPDLVKAALAGRSLDEFRKLADIKPPPSVAIVDTPGSVSAEEVIVTLNVADQGGGIGDVRLYRNGSAVMLEAARNLQVAQGSGHLMRYKVRLESGPNQIRAVAFNADNSMQSTEAQLTVTASFAAKRPSLYAVAIGIQDFKNPRLKLNYPVADARLFAETLRAQAGTLFQTVDVRLLTTPEETTRERLIEALTELRHKVKPEDLFVFFVASHGTADEGEYFLITSNVGALSTQRLKIDALTQAELKGLLSNIPTSKKLIVIDTCNAGALGDALQAAFLTRGMTDATAMKILGRAVGSTVLSASTSAQEAIEGYRGHGLFTYVIAEGLAGKADANNDGFVSTLELAAYVDARVPVLAEEVFKHVQYPVVSPSGQGFPLVKVR